LPSKIAKKRKNHQGGGANAFGSVRIISGQFRGRKLTVLSAEGLRPTSDRVRETVFNWLQFDLAGSNCLDVFAGSGALGFEALSRGVSSVTMLELDSDNFKQLQKNKQSLDIDNLNLIKIDALKKLTGLNEKQGFDLVFVDPPFHQGMMQETVDLLFTNNWLKQVSGILYLEQEKDLAWPELPKGWICFREKTTSQVKFGLFRNEQI
jgi:16S rRNA (guanine966-N2)-methyltransferase